MRYWVAIFGFILSGSALAGQADICYSAATPNGLVDKLISSTPLDCPVAGRHSLAQLAQAGWSVASAQPVTVDYGVDPASQAPHSSNSWMVIIQKEGNK
jgi:hypothetical protein